MQDNLQLIGTYSQNRDELRQLLDARVKAEGVPAVLTMLDQRARADDIKAEQIQILARLDSLAGSRQATELMLEENELTSFEPF